MNAIDRAGAYQAIITDSCVSASSQKKCPQFVATLVATALYDDVSETWIDWTEYGQGLTGYFVLMTKNDQGVPIKCLSYEQVQEATGWDGETFAGLDALDLKGKVVQIQVSENEYQGKITYQANYIRAEDAAIGLRKMTKEDLTKLETEYGVQKNKATAPTAAKKKTAPKKAAPKAPKGPKPTETAAAKPCTEDEAFQACLTTNEALGDKAIPDNILNDYWLTRVAEIAADSENVTDEEYGQIRVKVLEDIEIPY